MSSLIIKALAFGALAAPAVSLPQRMFAGSFSAGTAAAPQDFSFPGQSGTMPAGFTFPGQSAAAPQAATGSGQTAAAAQASASPVQSASASQAAPVSEQDAAAPQSSAAAASPSAAASSSGGSMTDLCGDSSNKVLSGTPWIVYNMLYNAAQTQGTQCTSYGQQTTSGSGDQALAWSSETNIEYVESTNNVPKGYSFVGLTENLSTQLSAISSIPATYNWERTNTTAFKGNECFDFIVAPTAGDSTSTAAKELMLWLNYEGGQLPIGWGTGTPAATVDSLFGTSWKLYEGTNTDSGITVHSLLPDTQFEGKFSGDLKEWLQALVTLGRFESSTYVNVGNGGTEMFYGDSVLNSTFGLQINL